MSERTNVDELIASEKAGSLLMYDRIDAFRSLGAERDEAEADAQRWRDAMREAFACDEDAPVEPRDIVRFARALAEEHRTKAWSEVVLAALADEDEERTLIALEAERAGLLPKEEGRDEN